ncbi:hypothetical protein Golax_001477, partial [Gossypium laxum]|nr:hypothetical protein [Gossypium laxum]
LGAERGIKPSKKPRPEVTNIFLRHDVANPTLHYSKTEIFRVQSLAPPAKPITSPVSDAWYPTLALLMLSIGLVVTASFFITEYKCEYEVDGFCWVPYYITSGSLWFKKIIFSMIDLSIVRVKSQIISNSGHSEFGYGLDGSRFTFMVK